ncbi:MAG: hypothetical protein L6R39_007326 [Caloplaca ligustica]|nr:MAG: hypothetical protein L6R39_007326 [Caloplaca ligustica]
MGGGKVPDAWDDDWLEKADSTVPPKEPALKPAKISKAERRVKQAEFNRQLEAQNQNFFLSTRTEVPLMNEFKPAMKVLSRKPATAVGDLGVGQLSIDNDEQDEEEDDGKARPLTAEERQVKAQKEREEKQKKYEEARQRLFGANNSAEASRSTTPPRQRASGDSRGSSKGGGTRDGRPSASGASGTGVSRQLYDPNDSAKPDAAYLLRKDKTPTTSGRSTPSEQQPIRSPRGPDGSGRGGFGFAPRGGKVS